MLSVTNAFKTAAVASTRQVLKRVTCWFLDNTMLSGYVTATCGASESIFAATRLVNGQRACQKTWALARDDCYPGDAMYPLDDDYEGGWMSDETSDGSAELSPAEEIVLTFATAQRVSDVRWWADAWIGYPVDFIVYYWDEDGENWEAIDTVTGNTETEWSTTLAAEVQTTGIKMEISKISRANDHPALVELQAGLVADLTSYVLGFDVNKERYYRQENSIPLGNLAAGELNLRLDNTDSRFYAKNTSGPYYGYLRPNRRIEVELGFVTSGGDEYCDAGVFYTAKWEATDRSPEARVRGLDRSKLFQAKMFDAAVYEGYTISELVELLAAAGGLGPSEYSVDATTYEVPYAVLERRALWEHLKQLAIGEAGYLYFDESGTLVFEDRDHLAGHDTSLATLDDSTCIVDLSSLVDEGSIRNLVRVTSKRKKEAASDTIWSLQETITVPGTGLWWDAAYLRRRQVQITADAGAGNNIVTGNCLKLAITGADAAAIYGVCQSDGGDLRVVYVSGGYTELDRFVEVFTSTQIVIYFRAQANIAAGDSDDDYWIYYYNTSAGEPPDDGTDVFDTFDGFDRAALGADWDYVDGLVNTWIVNNNHLVNSWGIGGTERCCWYDTSDAADYWECCAKVRYDPADPLGVHLFGIGLDTSKALPGHGAYIRDSGSAVEARIETHNGTSTGAIASYTFTSWRRLRVVKKDGAWTLYVNDVQVATRAADTWSPSYRGAYDLHSGDVATYAQYDNFWVRYLKATDPTVALIATEEEKPALVSGASTATITVQFQGPAVDVAAPVITSGGADVSVQSYVYTATGGTVVLQNTGPDETVDGMTIDGKLLESDGEFVAEAENPVLVAEFGERAYELENDFIQSLEQAQEIADALLGSCEDAEREIVVQMPARGWPHLQLGDRVTVESTRSGINADYYVVRSRLVYNGGLDGELTLLAAG